MNMTEGKLEEFKVGQKVINIDKENLHVEVGVLTAVHGEGEYDIDTHLGTSVSPIVHDGEGSCIYPLPDDVYDYLCVLEKHALATGFFRSCDDGCCDEDCECDCQG